MVSRIIGGVVVSTLGRNAGIVGLIPTLGVMVLDFHCPNDTGCHVIPRILYKLNAAWWLYFNCKYMSVHVCNCKH